MPTPGTPVEPGHPPDSATVRALNPVEAVAPTYCALPAKLAIREVSPSRPGVKEQVAIPFASVKPAHDWPSRVKVMVTPAIAVTG